MRHEIGFAAPDAHLHVLAVPAPYGLRSLLAPPPREPVVNAATEQDTVSVRYNSPAEVGHNQPPSLVASDAPPSYAAGPLAGEEGCRGCPMSYEDAVRAAGSDVGGNSMAASYSNATNGFYPSYL
jgi:hypothetical protein